MLNHWQDGGATEAMHGELRRQYRIAAGRKPEPSAAAIDSQSVKLSWADGGYGGTLVTWAKKALKLTVQIVRRPDDLHTFQVLPRRWVVERTLAWITRCRRTVRDYELPRRRGNSYYPEILVIPS